MLTSSSPQCLLEPLYQRRCCSLAFSDFLTCQELNLIREKIYELREQWLPGASGVDFTVGRTWYTAIANDEMDEYFDEAGSSRQLIQTSFPGLEELILDYCSALVNDEPVSIREGWAGPGFYILPPDTRTAKYGGVPHIDCDGLQKELRNDLHVESYSFICPIQLPESGGNLRVWNTDYYQEHNKQAYLDDLKRPEGSSTVIQYEVGALYAINSLQMHQIESCQGAIDRMTLTFHLAKLDNRWQLWF